MEPHAFVAELYRRMSLRSQPADGAVSWQDIAIQPAVIDAEHSYAPLLPGSREAAILDIGFGGGWFLAACIKLGYTNLFGAEFGIENRQYVKEWSPAVKGLLNIESNIGDLLAGWKESFDLIHLSHVIEHIPKYSLLYIVDSMYWALKPGGTLVLRTPNMEAPCANSAFYVTMAHEYGFAGSNLASLLSICSFDDVRFHEFRPYRPSIKQRAGRVMRAPIVQWNKIKHRLFGVNQGGKFGAELVVSARRGSLPPLFDAKYK
jgi:2-polyprenyl-3-methyl-5-hydroxy-6-metoxy-1,4-benzoquinol methylase